MESTPTKILLERHVVPGRDAEMEAWIVAVLASARATDALEGSSVFAHDVERLVLLRFHTEADLHAWKATAEAKGLFASTDIAPAQIIRSGLETWFTLPGHPVPRMPPPRWKMALLTWTALLPTVFVMSHIVPRLAPHPVVLPISTGLTVCVLTWVLMPNLVRVVHHWLYPTQSDQTLATPAKR
ncbi:MAG TPA: hypothetical protein VGM90_14515 [Kofleriaceae bacterium]|jgi:hypothetical protein